MKRFYANSAVTIAIIVAVLVLGVSRFLDLPIALYPQTSKPELWAGVGTGSMSADEFRRRYGSRIENALRGQAKVEKVQADYNNGSVQYQIEYVWGVESEEAKEDARSAVASIEAEFPKEWGGFWYWFGGSEGSRVYASIFSPTISAEDLAEMVEASIVPQVEAIEGLGESWLSRYDRRYVKVVLNPDEMNQLGVAASQIRAAIMSREYDSSIGSLDLEEGGTYQVVVKERPNSVSELAATPVSSRNGRVIRLSDVAEIEYKVELPKQLFKANGRRSLILAGSPAPEANIREVSESFLSIVKIQAESLDPSIEVQVVLDPSTFINEAVRNVLIAVAIGMLIATLIVYLFLGSLRTTVVISISIPVSLIGGFILMDMFGMEVNLISLGAMALAVGMVVDGAIVVLENITRHLDMYQPKSYDERLEVVANSVAEVRAPIVASLMTTIIVFAPLPFTAPLASAILGDLAIVMVCVLVVSVFVTIFLIPPLIVLFQIDGSENGLAHDFAYVCSSIFKEWFHRLQGLYLTMVETLMDKRHWSLGSAFMVVLLLAGGSYVLLTDVKREVMAKPDTDKVFFNIKVKGDPLEMEETESLVATYEGKIREELGDYITHTLVQVRAEGRSWILLFLKDKSQLAEFKEKLEKRFQNTPKFDFDVWDWNPTQLRIPRPPLLRISIAGKDEDQRRQALKNVKEFLDKNDGVGWVDAKPGTSKADYLSITVDSADEARLGPVLGGSLRNALSSNISPFLSEQYLMNMEIRDQSVSVRMQVPEKSLSAPTDINNIIVKVGDEYLPVRALATVTHSRDWSEIYAEDGVKKTMLTAYQKESFKGDPIDLENMLKEQIGSEVDLEGSSAVFGDTQKEINENISSLIKALLISIALIFIVICLQFGGFLQTSVIMLAVPFGFIGVAWSLWFFDSTLSVNSMLGLILLGGTAVNNSILFVDFFNRRFRQDGVSLREAILDTAALRFRPIMITTCTTILGMMPIAIGFGSGGRILQPLGIAVSGGLWISTLLILCLLPIVLVACQHLSSVSMKWLRKAFGLSAGTTLIFLVGMGPWGGLDTKAFSMNLEDAELMSIRNHPDVKVQEAKLDQAKSARGLEYSSLLPEVEFSRTYGEQKLRLNGSEEIVNHKLGLNTFRVSETVSNPLRLYNRLSAHDYSVASKVKQLQRTRDVIRRDVRVQYFKVVAAESSLQFAKEGVKAAKQIYDIAERRFRGGLVSEIDFERAKIRLLQIQNEVSVRERNAKTERHNFMILLGENEVSAETNLTDSLPTEFKLFKSSANDWEKRLVSNGEPLDVASARDDVEAAKLAAKNSGLSYLPDLTLSVEYSKQDPNQEEFEPKGPQFVVGGTWKVFSGGSKYFERRQVLASRTISEQSLIAAERLYRTTLKSELLNLSDLQVRYDAQLVVENGVAKVLSSSEDRFQKGLISARDVITDSSQYLEAQDQLLSLKLSIIRSLAELALISSDADFFKESM